MRYLLRNLVAPGCFSAHWTRVVRRNNWRIMRELFWA